MTEFREKSKNQIKHKIKPGIQSNLHRIKQTIQNEAKGFKPLSSFLGFITGLLCTSLPNLAFASQIGVNAWERVLYNFSQSLTGPVAYAISLIAIVLCGVIMAFSDLQGGAKRFVQAACGLSIAFFATQIVTNFLGFSGALI